MSGLATPICRCRVLYLGSAVPQASKDGLQGIQQPLQELYPEQGGPKGLDSWLSVWSNGLLLENVDASRNKVTRFFPIQSLHYCAAVRYVLVPEKNTLHNPTPRFLPLDSPFARAPSATHPPLFACILRRTTGIKVLECHAFICRRELAANALVRCCFHAYADSSYARQVEGISEPEQETRLSKEKLEDWKLSRSQSGSTMTINTVGNQKDDISIYNGDENHKVWAGSQDNLDGIYEVYSTSTLTRPQRPRQISQPVEVPPPPAPKDKKKKKSKSKEDLYCKANSVSGTMLKPRMSNHPALPPMNTLGPNHPLYILPHPGGVPPMATLPNPKYMKHGNTFSHRPSKKMLIPASRPIPPPFVPISPIIIPSSLKKKKKPPMDEPIYMPRPLSPPGPPGPPGHPGHPGPYPPFPPEAYLMQQYATMESPKKKREKDKKMSKKLAQSMNGLDDPNLEESPFNTGIYRKKGHLNERAFSYSIRQEHRSRSYGSLANLKFATSIPNGVDGVEDSREDLKKEREIMQMVQDLDLSGDEIERSEVPRGMYQGPSGAPVVVNGRSPRR